MKSLSVARAALTVVLVAAPGVAFAQAGWTPAAEIVGQPVQVTTAGVTDTVVLSPGGQMAITSPGGRVVPGTWSAANGQLCLNTGAQECFPYASPFQAGRAVTVTSSCNATSTWIVASTNATPAPPPPPEARGERGR